MVKGGNEVLNTGQTIVGFKAWVGGGVLLESTRMDQMAIKTCQRGRMDGRRGHHRG